MLIFQGKKHLFKNYNITIHKNKLNVIGGPSGLVKQHNRFVNTFTRTSYWVFLLMILI